MALKLLLGGLGRDVGFLRESQVTARLTDPHVPIHSWGEIDGRLYLDMRYVEGEDLGQRLARHGPLPPQRAVAVLAQVARALDSAHRSGLVHRDVKPSNVLLAAVEPDEEDFAYLVDFGIARSLSGDTSGSLTGVGTAIGTLDYMAPERFAEQPVDHRADVYALACVLYESLTGPRPFLAEGLPALMSAHIRTPPPRVSALAPVPAALDGVIARGMAKDPDERYPSAGALAAAARAVITTPVPLPGTPTLPGAAAGTIPPVASRPAPAAPPSWLAAPVPAPARPLHPAAAGRPPPRRPHGPIGAAGLLLDAPPRGARRSRRGLVVAGALVTVAAIVGTVVALASGGAGGGAGPTPSVTPTTPNSPTLAQSELLAALPAGFDEANCTPAPARQDARVDAALECEGGPAGGPSSAVFLRYRTAEQLDASLQDVVVARGLLSRDVDSCRNGAAVTGTWSRNDEPRGLVICYGDPNTGANLEWTDERALARAIVTRLDADPAAFYDWWLADDFR